MRRPNVLLIAIDTLRADHMSCDGYYMKTTPNIDTLSKNGVIFRNCIAPVIPTHPGFTTIFTGRKPLSHKIVCHAGKEVLSKRIETLPEIMYKNKYVTSAVDNLASSAPWFLRGFEYYNYSGGIVVISRGIKVTGKVVTEKAIKFLEFWKKKLSKRPFFLFVHYWDPHAPYFPPEDLIKKFYRKRGIDIRESLRTTKWGQKILNGWIQEFIKKGLTDKGYVDSSYDAEIYYSDKRIHELISYLDEIGEMNNTLILITADHGEGLGENEIFYDHHGLYDWDIRVPLIMIYPDLIPGGKRVKDMVTHEDILPTVLDIAGINYKGSLDGTSLLPIIREKKEGRDFVVSVENTRMTKRAIRTTEWKLIQTLRSDIYGREAGYLELFKIKDGESKNVLTDNEDVAKDLLFTMENWYRRMLKSNNDPLALQEISLPI